MSQTSPTFQHELGVENEEEADRMATASLFDVLTSRNRFLEEKELWALCHECCLTLEYVHDHHDLFQSLCISPDTVAFDREGNICFLDLDMEPDSMYLAPEHAPYGQKSYKSHLFSLGMTLLFATEYNTSSSDLRAALSDTFTDLFTTMTSDEIEHRPDLDTVIEACEKALAEESSQEICMKIIGLQCSESPESKEVAEAGFHEKTDELSAYLGSQSGLVQSNISDSVCSTSADSNEDNKVDGSNVKGMHSTLDMSNKAHNDFNDNCLHKAVSDLGIAANTSQMENECDRSLTLQDTRVDEEKTVSRDQGNDFTSRHPRKQGILLADLLNSLDRCLDESELWSICRECVISLQRKKKHFPAYISLDTIIIRDSGTACFKATPEDKPLETIYMAPELQQKGILNDKTCLYGLGIALHSAADFKYSSSQSIPNGEALEILITSFTSGNPDQRPDLDTAFEMCGEYEKVSKTNSQEVCLQLYKEALNTPDSLNETASEKMTQVTSDNIHSLILEDTAKDNTNEVTYDKKQKNIPTLTTVSQSALDTTITEATGSHSVSAFRNVASNQKPVKDMNRVPSAFSSPATHFKPIILQNAVTKSAVSDQQNLSMIKADNGSHSMATNRKQSLLEHNILETSERESVNMKHISERNSLIDSVDLGQTLHQLQSQGQLPSTDVLASVLAHYLSNCLTDSASKQGHRITAPTLEHSNSISTTSNDASMTDSSTQTSTAVPNYSMQPQPLPQMNHLLEQSLNHNFHAMQQNNMTVTTTAASQTVHIPQSLSGNISGIQGTTANSGDGLQSSSSNIHATRASLAQMSDKFPFPQSTAGVVNHGSTYSVPYSGLSPSNLPVQYTLVHDPATGLMQMLPVPCVPVSHTQTSQGIQIMQNYLPSTNMNIHPTSGAKLYNTDHGELDWSFRFSQQPNLWSSVPDKLSPWHQDYPDNHRFQTDGQLRSADKLSNGYPTSHNFRTRVSHQQVDGDGNNLQSFSASPSKGSGISLMQQPKSLHYSLGRQQSSVSTNGHVIFSSVVRILQETFAVDGLLQSGTEAFAIAEYIMSLSSLAWDTFRNAVTEKYFHLVWSYEVLELLYDTIGGCKPAELKQTAELLPTKFNKPLHSNRNNKEHQQSESETENFNKQRRYQLFSHQQQDRKQFSNQQHQVNQGGQHLTNQENQKIQERQQFFNQPKEDRQERPQLSNKHQQDRYIRQQLSKQYKLDSQERQLFSNQTHPVQAAAPVRVTHSEMPQLPPGYLRPRSEIRRQKYFWSEPSDSTDSDARERKQRFKKRSELDNTKRSLSLHNINFSGLSSNTHENYGTEVNQRHRVNSTGAVSQNYQDIPSKDHHKVKPSNINKTNNPVPSHICQYHTSSGGQRNSASPQSDKTSVHSSKNCHQIPSTHSDSIHTTPKFPEKYDGYNSPPASVDSHSSSKSDGSLEHKQQISSTYTETRSASKQKTQHSQENSNSHRATVNVLPFPSPYTHSIPYLPPHLQVNRDCTDLHHFTSPLLQYNNASNSQKQHPSNGHNNSPQINHSISSNGTKVSENQRLSTNIRSIHEPVKPPESSIPLDYPKSQGQNQCMSRTSTLLNAVKYQGMSGFCDPDVSLSVEMRKLAAEKPELYKDRCSTESSMLRDNGKKTKCQQYTGDSQNPCTLPTEASAYTDIPHYNIHSQNNHLDLSGTKNSHNVSRSSPPGPKNGSLTPSHKLSEPELRTRCNKLDDNGTNQHYGRSFSAVYSRQSNQPPTGVKVLMPVAADNSPDACHRRGSDGSVQLPEVNRVLLPYVKKSSVVYHSAVIQLSLTAEVDAFINSIDEENRPAIEKSLAGISQEITVQRRQRQKTQRLYKKLNDQNIAAGKKGDQNVSDQMLKDITDMTKKLSFLHLCQTHLQMLLAELHGLDSSFLYSLSISEGNSTLNLQSVTRNPYLQFRTISTPEAEQMAVLQAGTPRGLMSYLYTSSALSNGYIHQFLLCFRYILTADQLLTFIMEKYFSAQRSNQKDVNMVCIQSRSIDLLHFWIEGYYSIDFAPNKGLLKKFADFLVEQTNANVEGTDNLFSLYAACRMGENTELLHMTGIDEDITEEGAYYFYLDNPKRWDSFRSLLKRSKSDKSKQGSSSSYGKSRSTVRMPSSGNGKPSSQFSVAECSVHILAEQLTLIEQELFKKCHPVHFLNSQFQGVGVALSMPGLRTPSMSRKSDAIQGPKRGLFVGDPAIDSYVVHMINHAQELAHWVSAEILSCGSNKTQTNVITKFLTAAHLCLDIRNYATALSILDGLENLVVRQLPVWKNFPAKPLTYMDELTNVKMKLKSEALWLMSEKDCYIYPTIPCALFVALHIQQVEIGSFTLASGMYKWDKMRSISEIVDQLRIFRDHDYGFQPDYEIQRSLRRCLSEFSEQDLHSVASTQDNNFRRHPSSTSLSGTLKKVMDVLKKKT